MERLLIRPQAKHDESLLGYLLRLTEENVFQSILSLVRLGDLDSKNEKSSVNDYIKALVTGDVPLEQLAARTGEITSALDLKRYPALKKGSMVIQTSTYLLIPKSKPHFFGLLIQGFVLSACERILTIGFIGIMFL